MATFIQTKQNSGVAGTSLVITPTNPLAQGNLVVLTVKFATTGSNTPTATDNASIPNTYAVAIGPIDSGGFRTYLMYGAQVTGGATTVTISWANGNASRINLDEYSGTAPTNASVFDKAASNTGTGTSASVALLPATDNELIVAGLSFSGTPSSPVAGANYAITALTTTVGSEYRLAGTTNETAPISWNNSPIWAEVTGAFNATTTSTSSTSSSTSTSLSTSTSSTSTSVSTSTSQSTSSTSSSTSQSTSISISTSSTSQSTSTSTTLPPNPQVWPHSKIRTHTR